jgi:hypothetical protein
VQDVDSINERNAVYNRKIARAFVSCCQLPWLCIRLYDFFIIPCPGQIHRRNSAKSGKGNSVAFVNVHVLQPIMRRFYVEHTRRGTRPKLGEVLAQALLDAGCSGRFCVCLASVEASEHGALTCFPATTLDHSTFAWQVPYVQQLNHQ